MLNLVEVEEEWAMLLMLLRSLLDIPPVEEGPVSTTAHAFAESYDILRKLDAVKNKKNI